MQRIQFRDVQKLLFLNLQWQKYLMIDSKSSIFNFILHLFFISLSESVLCICGVYL